MEAMSQMKPSLKYISVSILLFTGFFVSTCFGETSTKSKPDVENLGNGKYRIGKIKIDKPNKSFIVPGKVIRLDPPLEFLAVTKNGYKAYESLLELDVNAYEFNLACILIGLDAKSATLPKQHFDEAEASGDGVDINVSWEAKHKKVTVRGEQLLNVIKSPKTGTTWAYMGSRVLSNGTYLAQQDGTLIGFVHDPSSVIEHRLGLGLGNYGEVGANKAVVPPVGTRVELQIRNSKK
jgi:hypothetical protein